MNRLGKIISYDDYSDARYEATGKGDYEEYPDGSWNTDAFFYFDKFDWGINAHPRFDSDEATPPIMDEENLFWKCPDCGYEVSTLQKEPNDQTFRTGFSDCFCTKCGKRIDWESVPRPHTSPAIYESQIKEAIDVLRSAGKESLSTAADRFEPLIDKLPDTGQPSEKNAISPIPKTVSNGTFITKDGLHDDFVQQHDETYVCPICKTVVDDEVQKVEDFVILSHPRQDFCRCCGQKIDWTGISRRHRDGMTEKMSAFKLISPR